MIGISWTEMLVIGVFALIFIGPKELPVVMHRIGKMLGTVRRLGTEFSRELNKATGLDAVTDIRRTITEPLKKTTAEIAREFNTMTKTGVEPSGVIKPSEAGAQTIVPELRAAAGLEPAEPVKTGAVSGVVAKGEAGPAMAPLAQVEPPQLPAVVAQPSVPAVEVVEPVPASPKKPRTRARKANSPASFEALPAPVKAPRRRAAVGKTAPAQVEAAATPLPKAPRRKSATGPAAARPATPGPVHPPAADET